MRIKWKEDYSAGVQRNWGVGIGLLTGLLIGVPIGWGGADLPTNASFILAFFTAVGTISAAVGAVWIAGRAEKNEKLANKLQADIYALYIVKKLEFSLNNLEMAVLRWDFGGTGKSDERCQRFVDDFNKVSIDISMQDIARLRVFGAQVIQWITRAKSDVESLKAEIHEYERQQSSPFTDMVFTGWIDTAVQAEKYLIASVKHLSAVCNSSFSTPDPEYIYGDSDEL